MAIMVRNRSETIGRTTRASCEVGYGGATADTCVTRWMIGLTIGAMVTGATIAIGDVSRATIDAMVMGATIVKDKGSKRGARANCWTCEVLEVIAAKVDDV